MICTFFGHRDTGVLEIARLQEAIEELILKGAYKFVKRAKRLGLTVMNLGDAKL